MPEAFDKYIAGKNALRKLAHADLDYRCYPEIFVKNGKVVLIKIYKDDKEVRWTNDNDEEII